MKTKLLFLIAFLLVLLPLALAQTAQFTLIVPDKIIYNVPFSAQVQVASGSTNFIDYDLSLGSESHRVNFNGATLSRNDPFQLSTLTGSQENGHFYRVRTETNGNTLQGTQPLFTLSNLLVGSKKNTEHAVVQFNPPPLITAAASGVSFTISSVESGQIPLSVSTCGDGVVGYFDNGAGGGTANNGIKDGAETEEKCDEGTTATGGEGCHNCQYAEIGYKIMPGKNCAFGSYNCALQAMNSRELLREKLVALLNGQCYPVNHPDPLYCEDAVSTDADTAKDDFIIDYANFNAGEKIKFLAQVSAALKEYFKLPS